MAAFAMGRLLEKKTGVKTPLSMSPLSKVFNKVIDKRKKKKAFEKKSIDTSL